MLLNVFDLKQRELSQHNEFLLWKSNRGVLSLGTLVAISVESEFVEDPDPAGLEPGTWYYHAVLILESGSLFRLSDTSTRTLEEANAIAKFVAALLDIPYLPGTKEHKLFVDTTFKRPIVRQDPSPTT